VKTAGKNKECTKLSKRMLVSEFEEGTMHPLIVGIITFAFSVLIQTTAAAVGVALMVAMIRRGRARGSFWNITHILQLIIFILLVAHLIQIGAWALVFVWCHEFSDFDAAFYHSAVNYTTLGYGDIVMSPRWRLLGPMEAMDGILMSGLSTAILFSVLHRLVDRRLAIHQSAHGLISAESPMKRLGNDPYAQGNEGI
jgi:Ion channel